ncbi:MAG: DUF393 domain-containing protein [Planctomycetota bacterium]|nr:DUF393 domain-containing protein [Planctomycetota bacterium]
MIELYIADCPPPLPDWQVEVFFDGDCPFCCREIAWLRRRDKRGRINFVDIADAEFSPATLGVTHDDLMAEIHGRLPDGTLLRGVEVFRQLYTAVGFTPIVAATRLPGIKQVVELGYRIFARNRLRLTGRCTTECKVR